MPSAENDPGPDDVPAADVGNDVVETSAQRRLQQLPRFFPTPASVVRFGCCRFAMTCDKLVRSPSRTESR